MEKFLRDYLKEKIANEAYYSFDYSEDINKDALSDKWLTNRTSYIYKVAVLTAIDRNKCDYAHVVIGTQRNDESDHEIKGYFHFCRGENDDMGKTIERAVSMLKLVHPAFEA